jgi:hypothetical protein
MMSAKQVLMNDWMNVARVSSYKESASVVEAVQAKAVIAQCRTYPGKAGGIW